MRNPFVIREIQTEEPFCDRAVELKELFAYGESFTNVVLYSHRRYGKTSLVKRVQDALQKQGMIIVYTDFFGVVTIDEVAEKLAKCLYTYCHKSEGLFKKAMRVVKNWRPIIKPDPEMGIEITVEPTTREYGLRLLEETFNLFGSFAREYEKGLNVVIDEFQEIVNLPNSIKVEAILRSQIQNQTNVGYIFVGSRRRMLLEMFSEQKRPFYKSSIHYTLGPLPETEAIAFIIDRFKHAAKDCPVEVAKAMYDSAEGCPYYVQRIPYEVFALSDTKTITPENHKAALTSIVKIDTPYYQCVLSGLSTVQRQVLYSLAKEPAGAVSSTKYLSRHRLSSAGSTQPALKKLIALDLIEKRDGDGRYHVIDPFFAAYLTKGI